MIKAVIFDMNGVIIDDEPIHEEIFRETLRPYGIDLDHQTYQDCCAGKTCRAGYEELAVKYNVSLPVDDLLKQKFARYLEIIPSRKKAFPGAIELIHSLSGEFRLALSSSATAAEVELITREFGIDQEFEAVVTANDVIKGKPDPEPYLVTARKLGVQPEECVVIEDAKSGVESAKRAGCYCIGVLTSHLASDLREADLVVDDFFAINLQVIRNLVS